MPVTLAGIELPEDIAWPNELSGHGVGQVQNPSIEGSLIIEEIANPNGRPITLATGSEVWVERQTVEQVDALAGVPLEDDESHLFVWSDGRQFEVVFDRSKGSPVIAKQIIRRAASGELPTHPYSLTIYLKVKE